MAQQKRTEQGQFTSKSDEPRKVRSIRITDTAWEKLGKIAASRCITRADLIEEWIESKVLDEPDLHQAKDTAN